MFLAKLSLQNWRTYGDATFDFEEPTSRRSIVLVGAMNGHGKTSFLVSLYLGLFGRFGLRYCEGFRSEAEGDFASYRQAISKYRRNTADPDEPTVIDITFKPTISDRNEEEVRVVRRWYFTGKNEPKQGDAFEEVDVFVGDRLQKKGDLDKDPIILAHERIERNLFPAHVAPAFFFDGEQAQELIENMGEAGIKKAVEVMFGTKVVAEVAETMSQYLVRSRSAAGGKKRSDEREDELTEKVTRRNALNERIAKLQAEHVKLEREKDERERERSNLQEELARLGGAGADIARLQAEVEAAQKEHTQSEKLLADAARSLGLALALSRLTPAIGNRLRAEDLRETWEGLRRGTVDKSEDVLAVALPEPPEKDPLLGNIATHIREKVRQRFIDALERIYNPPNPGCASEYLLGHVKGEARTRVLVQLNQVQNGVSTKTKGAAKRLRESRDRLDDLNARMQRAENLPVSTKEIKERLENLNALNQEISRKLGGLENEVRKLKSDLHVLNEDVGRVQEELARLGPEQKRMAVAERVCRALDELQERLRPTTTERLEEAVTRHFIRISDKRFRSGTIRLPAGGAPEIDLGDGETALLEMFSGFEKRSFGIAFTLALAELTKRRLPLVIDTPLGNADSEYRPRTLKALTDFDLDQAIILTHDEEVTPELVRTIQSSIRQTFLVEFQDRRTGSIVHPNQYFPTR